MITLGPSPRPQRRGNAMILVAGVLVLLAVLATAFVTRTQGGRDTASAVQKARGRDDNHRVIGEEIATTIAEALFPRAVDPNYPGSLFTTDSNRPRLSAARSSQRYGVDQDQFINASGLPGVDGIPDFPWNFAPHEVVPWTNYPDLDEYPAGQGAPSGQTTVFDENPIGGPGFGDARWLRDFEPLRWDLLNDVDTFHETFRQWRHLTNLSRDDNGWRICWNISDVENFLLADLNVPVEQWMPQYLPDASVHSALTGAAIYDGASFVTRWQSWLGSLGAHAANYDDPSLVPPNFYALGDLNGDGLRHNVVGERPEDEFIKGTARWNVSAVLADADGDGFTDSFWHLVPTPISSGVRQLVAVSIVDNGAMLNANVASRFMPGLFGGNPDFLPWRSAGETPADLALVGEANSLANSSYVGPFPDFGAGGVAWPANWNVGFFDSYLNRERGQDHYGSPFGSGSQVNWNSTYWPVIVADRGVTTAPGGAFASRSERLDWWLRAASRPLDRSRPEGYGQFALSDEMELRAYHGQNYPWISSRFENAVNSQSAAPGADGYAFLRSNVDFAETSAYKQQLGASELLIEPRRKITLYNGARNELLPSWLRWRWVSDDGAAAPNYFGHRMPEAIVNLAGVVPDLDGNGFSDAVDNFFAQSNLKADLREQDPLNPGVPAATPRGHLYLHERLPYLFWHALADGDEPVAGSSFLGYFGNYPGTSGVVDEFARLRKLSASLSANVLAWRDADRLAPLDGDPFLPGIQGGARGGLIMLPQVDRELPYVAGSGEATAFLGMEQQPFLMEAFLAHVHKIITVPGTHTTGPGWANSGKRMYVTTADLDLNGTPERYESTVSVVQIGNPYDTPLFFYDPSAAPPPTGQPAAGDIFVSWFGQEFNLSQVMRDLGRPSLEPTTEANPATIVIFSIEDQFAGDIDFAKKWSDFLDIRSVEQPSNSIIINLRAQTSGGLGGSVWSTRREDYDSATDADDALVLLRYDTGADPLDFTDDAKVVIDRMEPPRTSPFALDDDDSFHHYVTSQADGIAGSNQMSRPPIASEINPLPAAAPIDPASFWPDQATFTQWRPSDSVRTHWTQWARVSRSFAIDSSRDGAINPNERSPRFVVDRTVLTNAKSPASTDARGANYSTRIWPSGDKQGVLFSLSAQPDFDSALYSDPYAVGSGTEMGMPWFTIDYVPWIGNGLGGSGGGGLNAQPRKPTYFDFQVKYEASGSVPYAFGGDKGFYPLDLNNAMQMLQKDGDFQQVAELLHVWLWGHELKIDFDPLNPLATKYRETVRTFSERLGDDEEAGTGLRRGRLSLGMTIGIPATGTPNDPRHAVPALPAGTRVFDAFVCDGPGYNWDPLVDPDPAYAPIDPADPNFAWYRPFLVGNARFYRGQATPGLINLNTAPPEVLRAIPNWMRVVHSSIMTTAPIPAGQFPRSALPEAVVSYRERYDNAAGQNHTWQGGPDYSDRDPSGPTDDVRGTRGVAGIGEILLVDEPAPADITPGLGIEYDMLARAWTNSFGAYRPFASTTTAFLSTDLINPPALDATDGDRVGGDSEEASLLFAGASNVVSTRSDFFTVHFRVRSFRQNPVTQVWDATDPEYIIDDTRYVMLVDRSSVDRPGQAPRILYFERLPY